jgi:hypothetical protein
MGRKLRPFIWRDYESCTAQMDILVQINARQVSIHWILFKLTHCH